MPSRLKLVLGVPLALEQGRVDGAQDEVVLRARKVQQAQPVDVALVPGRQRDPVVFPSQLAEAGSQLVQGATRQPTRIEADGRSWWVGEDAQLADTPLTMHTAERLADAAFVPALVRAAYDRVGVLDDHTGSVCVSCLPAKPSCAAS